MMLASLGIVGSMLIGVCVAVCVLTFLAKIAANKAISNGTGRLRIGDDDYNAFEVRDRAHKWFLISGILGIVLFLFIPGGDR